VEITTRLQLGLAALIFVGAALLYTAEGFLPGHLLAPLDIPRDLPAWKGDGATRVRVSNSLLSDVALQLAPWDGEARRLIAGGEFPWINRYAGEGEPLFANPLAGLLSPFTWPRLLLGLRGWSWTVFLKIVAGGLSMFWLARVAGAEWIAALVSGLLFTLSGHAIVWALYPQTNVFVLLPAFGAAVLSAARMPSKGNLALVVLFAALISAGGHPETLFLGVVALVLFVAWDGGLAALRRGLIAAFAGFLMAGVHLVPFALLLSRSHVVLARSHDLTSFVRKQAIASLIVPGLLGSPLRNELDLTALITPMENFNQRTAAFIGLLALVSIALAWRELPVLFRRGLTIGMAGLVLSWSLPGIIGFMRILPIVQWVAVEYFALIFVLFASLAAGPALFAMSVRPRLLAALGVAGALMVIAGLLPAAAPSLLLRAARSGIAHLQASGRLHQPGAIYELRLSSYLAGARWMAFRRLALPGICWIVFAVSALRGHRRLTAVAAVAELMAFGLGYNPAIQGGEIAPKPAAIATIERRDPGRRWLMASSAGFVPPNAATTYRLRDVVPYDILTSEEWTRRLMAAGYDPASARLPTLPSPQQLRVLASLGVRFYVTPGGIEELPDVRASSLPRNDPPPGLAAGLAVSAGGLLLALILLATCPPRLVR
jgi:hypothetical protein